MTDDLSLLLTALADWRLRQPADQPPAFRWSTANLLALLLFCGAKVDPDELGRCVQRQRLSELIVTGLAASSSAALVRWHREVPLQMLPAGLALKQEQPVRFAAVAAGLDLLVERLPSADTLRASHYLLLATRCLDLHYTGIATPAFVATKSIYKTVLGRVQAEAFAVLYAGGAAAPVLLPDALTDLAA